MLEGRFPGPVKTIRREVAKRVGIGTGHGGGVRSVEFREVTEDYTSKLCSKCNEVLERMRDQCNKLTHAVRRCLTTSCVRVWHLDVNACRNIFVVFVHENSHQGQRPEKLTRRYPQHTLRSGQLRSKHATLVVWR